MSPPSELGPNQAAQLLTTNTLADCVRAAPAKADRSPKESHAV